MRKVLAFSLVCFFVMMSASTSVAKPAVDTSNGPVFGGQHTDINNQSNQTAKISLLPAVAEDFTATWCTNCVKVEHALDELEVEGLLQKYEFHVNPDLDESGFGSEDITQHLDLRYGAESPPLVAINGTIKKHGSLPESDSLVNDYRDMMQNPLDFGDASSSFIWAPSTENMGVITWNLDADLSAYPEAILSVNAWIVEQSAEFDGGSNGQGTYFDLVRQITDLGSNPQGTANITIPTPHDGDDLEVHLVYLLNMPIAEDNMPVGDDEADEETKSVPGFGVMITLLAGFSAALVARRI
tara:strand:- start:784 stop:1677 length:894 start_codon:yes stop_codon:yes gene_type:complete